MYILLSVNLVLAVGMKEVLEACFWTLGWSEHWIAVTEGEINSTWIWLYY